MTLVARFAAGYRRLQQLVAAVADFDQVLKSQTTVKTRGEVERIVMASIATELIGVPLAPPDLAVRLLPHLVPHVYQWRRLRGDLHDFTSEVDLRC